MQRTYLVKAYGPLSIFKQNKIKCIKIRKTNYLIIIKKY